MSAIYVNWDGAAVKLTWKQTAELPPRDLTTSIHGFCFRNEELLFVRLITRGWDIPGGHIEGDETPVECLKREAFEEGYVAGECDVLGYICVDHSENPHWDETRPYPKLGYQVFYKMKINRVFEFKAENESSERIFIRPHDCKNYYPAWNELYQEILEYALVC